MFVNLLISFCTTLIRMFLSFIFLGNFSKRQSGLYFDLTSQYINNIIWTYRIVENKTNNLQVYFENYIPIDFDDIYNVHNKRNIYHICNKTKIIFHECPCPNFRRNVKNLHKHEITL